MGIRAVALALVVGMLPGTAMAAPTLPAHYAALFEPGRRWTYQVERIDEVPHERGNKTVWRSERAPKRTVTCEVTEVQRDDRVSWARIACDDALDVSGMTTPAGTWMADDRGLHRLADRAPMFEIPAALARTPMIAATGARGPRCHERDDRSDPIGDGSLDRPCFRAGVGLDTVYFAYVGAFPYRVWLRHTR